MPTPQFPEAENAITRRDFFSWTVVGWAGFTAAMGAFLAASGRLFFPNITFEPPQQFKAGFPAEYAANKVDERFKKRYGVWLVRNERGIYCLSTVCTHLG
ncbi:MAG: Rieske (2Fe-2S) protein, partial [Deltaproteobacteria bacterium]|nr:Rieske (2Fe-2S) protein [Deltaproteobacteria bacterium]